MTPQPKQSFYFSHDSNARNDIKIVRLRRQLGMEGYGIYWCLIEILRETADYRLPFEAIEDIAYQIDAAKEKVETIVKTYGLFTLDKDHFFSLRLIRSMELYNNQKKTLSEAGKKGMKTRWEQPAAPPLKRLDPPA